MSVWKPIKEAPTDGTPFYALSVTKIIGCSDGHDRMSLDIKIMCRDERGFFWNVRYGFICADDHAGNLFAPLDAIPIKEFFETWEAERLALGGAPDKLPIPFDPTTRIGVRVANGAGKFFIEPKGEGA